MNTVTGQFSCGAAGLMIRDGELAEPVRETTVAATLPVILDGIVAIADDLRILPGGAMIPNRGGEPGTGNSVIAPAVVIRPMFPPNSVNHRSPPGPVVMSMGQLPGVGVGKCDTAGSCWPIWAGSIRPMLLVAPHSVNQSLSSGPRVTRFKPLPETLDSVIVPTGAAAGAAVA